MPRVGFYLVFIGPGGGGFELLFCQGGCEFAHQKNCPGRGGGMVRLGIDGHIRSFSLQTRSHEASDSPRDRKDGIRIARKYLNGAGPSCTSFSNFHQTYEWQPWPYSRTF